jgi:hypothetical protein
MDRVFFHIERTGERISCLLNPETVLVSRRGGVRNRSHEAGELSMGTGDHEPLVFTGGGRTVIELQLLFDVDEAGTTGAGLRATDGEAGPDVRTTTSRLWRLAENSASEGGGRRPPLVRVVWGVSWNIVGVIAAISERLDRFAPTGRPLRSWVAVRLVQLDDEITAEPELVSAPRTLASRAPDDVGAKGHVESLVSRELAHGVSALDPRALPLLAWERFGDPGAWRRLADAAGIDDPLAMTRAAS